MSDLFFLAQAHGDTSGLWYPTILGVLVVVAAILLFCGSTYVILATNLGARLGFLVAFTCLMGFMVLLSGLWITTSSPINTLRGELPSWKVEEVVPTVSESRIPEVRSIDRGKGRVVSEASGADIKAAADEALVTQRALPGEELEPGTNKFARFDQVTKFKVSEIDVVGGSDPHLLDWEISHQPQYAVVQFCEVLEPDIPFGVAPPDPECDPNSDQAGSLVLRRHHGTLRLPPVVVFFTSIVLFGIGLLALHWREKDERVRAAADAGGADAGRATLVPAET